MFVAFVYARDNFHKETRVWSIRFAGSNTTHKETTVSDTVHPETALFHSWLASIDLRFSELDLEAVWNTWDVEPRIPLSYLLGAHPAATVAA